MVERGLVRKREGDREESWMEGTGKERKGPAPGMCLGPRNMGIRPWKRPL